MNFVVLSYPRTGSTVLQRLINTSDNFTCIGEKPLVINHLYSFFASVNDAKTIVPNGLFPGIPIDDDRNPVYLSDKVDLDLLAHDIKDLYLKHILGASQSQNVGWKETFISPYPNVSLANRQIKFIRRLFPDMLFILNVRDPYQCSLSPIWQCVPDALDELTQTRNWIIQSYKDGLFGSNSILLDYDHWSVDSSDLINQLISVGINLDIEKSNKVLSEKLNHLSSVSPELSSWTKKVKRGI